MYSGSEWRVRKNTDRQNLADTGEKALLGRQPAELQGWILECHSNLNGTITVHAFLGHFIFPSADLCIHALHKSAASELDGDFDAQPKIVA